MSETPVRGDIDEQIIINLLKFGYTLANKYLEKTSVVDKVETQRKIQGERSSVREPIYSIKAEAVKAAAAATKTAATAATAAVTTAAAATKTAVTTAAAAARDLITTNAGKAQTQLEDSVSNIFSSQQNKTKMIQELAEINDLINFLDSMSCFKSKDMRRTLSEIDSNINKATSLDDLNKLLQQYNIIISNTNISINKQP